MRRKKTAGDPVATIVLWMLGRTPTNIPFGTLQTAQLLADRKILSTIDFNDSITSHYSSSGRHRKNSHHYALRAFRIPIYVLRAPKRRANISAVYRWSFQRAVFLLRIYRRSAGRLYLGRRAQATPGYIVSALQQVRCLSESSLMCFRHDGSDFLWLNSVSCSYSVTGGEGCSNQPFPMCRSWSKTSDVSLAC